MDPATTARLNATLEEIRTAGLFKDERVIAGPQGAEITLADGRRVLNFCANNYLGPLVPPAGHRGRPRRARRRMATACRACASSAARRTCTRSSRRRIARFLGIDDAILYAACFDANGGLFEPLLGEEDAIISDELNHASIIDGIRLCKAQRYRYAQQRHGRPRGAAGRRPAPPARATS